MIDSILEHLAALVACDTQNPPRKIATHDTLFELLASVCQRGFQIEVADHARGRIGWFARRGRPKVLFNVHLDTVPAAAGWSADPFRLRIESDRAIGLGACDIKGAAACLLALAQQSTADLAMLFTTDEEGSEPCCVQTFVESTSWRPELVVVGEPTGARAVTGHRGYLSQRGNFRGRAGHTSLEKKRRDSAVHRMVQWSANAIRAVDEWERANGPDADCCFNIGRVEGGIKGNMIADRAELRWSARLPPGSDLHAFLQRLSSLEESSFADWETTFLGPALPSTFQLREKAQQYIRALSLPAGPDVDFWTEAAIFSAHGLPAIVLGPGDIAQAHATDEWVAVDQLQLAYDFYSRIAHAD